MTKRRTAQTAVVVSGMLALVAAVPSTSDACFGWMFGRCCGYGGYSAFYAPAYTSYYYGPAYTSYYAPYAPAYCPPACCPSPCPPCGPGGCPGGVCGVNVQRPADQWRATEPGTGEPAPKTYSDEPGDAKPPTPNGTEPGFGPRSEDPFGSGRGAGSSGSPRSIETRRPATETGNDSAAPETVIEQARPAPAPAPSPDEDAKPGARPAPSPTPEQPKPEQPEATSPALQPRLPIPTLEIPTLELDDRLTGHIVPQHTRLTIRATFRSPTVVRRTAVPVPGHEVFPTQATRIAHK